MAVPMGRAHQRAIKTRCGMAPTQKPQSHSALRFASCLTLSATRATTTDVVHDRNSGPVVLALLKPHTCAALLVRRNEDNACAFERALNSDKGGDRHTHAILKTADCVGRNPRLLAQVS